MKRKPVLSCICIVDRLSGTQISKTIKNSPKTTQIVIKHFARHPAFFVYRVNIYPKESIIS